MIIYPLIFTLLYILSRYITDETGLSDFVGCVCIVAWSIWIAYAVGIEFVK